VALLVLCMAQFMLVLDIAVVNVGLPAIQSDLGFTPENLQLVVTAYALTFGGLLLFGGRAADLMGRRRMFIIGLAVFTVASLLCGLAESDTTLVAARALQGIGGALVSPAALSLLITTFPEGQERNKALGLWAAVGAGGAAAGLLIGGVLTDLADWRWVFLINVPIGAAVAFAATRVLPAAQAQATGKIDYYGALAATSGLMALVYGLSRGEQEGFSDGLTVALLVGSAVLLAAFVVIEQRVAEPLVPFRIFRQRTLTGANLSMFLSIGVMISMTFFLTLYFQQVLGFSPIETGLAFLPVSIIIGVVARVSSMVVERTGARPLLLGGYLVLVLGMLYLSRVSADGSYLADGLPGMALISLGMGVAFPVATVAATAGVSAHEQGLASGVLNTSQQVGSAVGLAVLATVASGAADAAAAASPAVALTDGFEAAFVVSAAIALGAAGAAFFLVRESDCEAELRRRRATGMVTVSVNAQTSPCQPAVVEAGVPEVRLPDAAVT
jgi:EmrB/QacA subfamily drug resistance transporter